MPEAGLRDMQTRPRVVGLRPSGGAGTTHKADDGTVWVVAEPPGRCEDCGAVEETRPYGPNGEQVCFSCMKKDEPAAVHQFAKLLAWPGVDGHPHGAVWM